MKCNLKKMLKGKKAQLGIGENIGNVLRTVPRPLLIVMFLIFLLMFSIFFSYVLNMFGVHCDSQDQVNLIPVYDAYHNFQLITRKPSFQDVNSYAVAPEQLTVTFAFQCVHKINDSYYFEGAFCTDCENVSYLTSTTTFIGLPTSSAVKVCVGDVYPNPDKGWFKKIVCNVDEGSYGCDIPPGYFFNHTTGYLEPTGNNSIYYTVGQMWDNKLASLEPRIVVETENSRAYDEAFQLSCSELVPTFKLYGIPVFDYRIWIFLILISVFIGAIIKIHNME